MNTTQVKLFKFDKGFLYSYENQNKANLHEYMHKVVNRYKISESGILNRFNTSPKEIEEKGDPTGIVEFYDEIKGFGFIKESDSPNKYFFHRSNAEYGIGENNMVTFRLEKGPRGMNAVEVKMLK